MLKRLMLAVVVIFGAFVEVSMADIPLGFCTGLLIALGGLIGLIAVRR